MADSYPRIMYHAHLAPDGKRFETPDIFPTDNNGWVDTPAKFRIDRDLEQVDAWLEGRVPARDDAYLPGDELCAIWNTDARREGHTMDSPRAGGDYLIDRATTVETSKLTNREKAVLTTHLNRQRDLGTTCPEVTISTVELIRKSQPLRINERARNLLAYIAREARNLGQTFSYWNGHEYAGRALAYSESIQFSEVRSLIDYLIEMSWLAKTKDNDHTEYLVTVPGYAQLERNENEQRRRPQGFVAMWFDAKLEQAFEAGFAKGIEDAGYDVCRVDKSHHNDKICDKIVAEIKRSMFVVADFTHGADGSRGGVYFEAGLAMGQGIPVFFTCREDCMRNVHFDTRQYNHIVWADVQQLRMDLGNRISAIVGDGPASPP